MIGPHYEKLAEVQQRMTSQQMLEKIQNRSDNPLHQIVDKLKKQFSEYQTAYDRQITQHQISSVDRLLSFDGKLGPILSTLEKENNLLRKQLSVLESQLSNTVTICEQVITENNEYKKIIEEKNQDIKKIIETIANNQSQSLTELQEKVSILHQENSILIRHMDEVKKIQQGYTNKFNEKDKEIQVWKRKWEQNKRHLNDMSSREQELARKLALAEHNTYQYTQKNYEMESDLQQLKFQNNQLKNQLITLTDDPVQKNPNSMRDKFFQEYSEIFEEHQLLKKERQEILKETEVLKIEKERMEDTIYEMERKFNKAINDLELTTSLLNEQKKKNNTLVATVGKLQALLDEAKNEGSKNKMENEANKSYSITRERALQHEIDSLRVQLDNKSRQSEKKMIQMREKTRALLQAKDREMESINQTNHELRKLLEHHHK